MNSNQSNSNSNDRLDRLEALVANYVETSVKESAELKSGLSELKSGFAELKSGLNETRQLVNSVARSAQANSDAIAELRRERQATDKQIAQTGKQVAQLTRELADFAKITKEGVAKLIEDRGTMFEMIQSLNDDRVKWSENLASIASSLNKIAK